MNKEALYLTYINEVGKDWKGEFIYEFLFSNSTDGVDGEYWDEFPASGKPEPPHSQYTHCVGNLKSTLKFDVVQNSDTFCLWDAVDGIVALAWENVNDYDEYPAIRTFFKFGQTLKSVEENLYTQDIILDVKRITEHERIEE